MSAGRDHKLQIRAIGIRPHRARRQSRERQIGQEGAAERIDQPDARRSRRRAFDKAMIKDGVYQTRSSRGRDEQSSLLEGWDEGLSPRSRCQSSDEMMSFAKSSN